MTDVLVELSSANPAPADAEPHPTAWSDSALLAEIDTRSGTEMRLDSKRKTERQRMIQGPRKWSRALVAAAGFAVVIGVVGVVALVIDGGTPTTEPPAASETTTSPPTSSVPTPTTAAVPTLSTEQRQFVEQYFDAWNNDGEAFVGLLAADVILGARNDWSLRADGGYGEHERERFLAAYDWHRAVGGVITADLGSCEPEGGLIVCDFTYADQLVASSLTVLDGRIKLRQEDGQVTLQEVIGGTTAAGEFTGTRQRFRDWLNENYPQDRPRMILANTYPLYTPESAALWMQYVPRYLGQEAPLNDDETAFVTSFVNAWNNDIEAFLTLVAPEAVVEHVGTIKYGIWVDDPAEMSRETFETRSRFEAAIGTQTDVDPADCFVRADAVFCPFTTTDILIANTVLHVSGVLRLQIADGLVQQFLTTWHFFNNGGSVMEFEAWAKANHASASNVLWDVLSPELAAVYNDLAPLFGARN